MRRRGSSSPNYWMSFADLMSALLMVFVLLLVVVVLDYREDLAEKEKQIEEITSVKSEIIAALMKEFENSNIELEIDPDTGAIQLATNILYTFNSSEITQEGKGTLAQFVPKYLDILLQDKYRDEISTIIIEGHADNAGDYLYNLNLSQERAFSVLKVIYANDFPNFEQKEYSKQVVTANGRSNVVPIYNESGEYDANASRRVEFLFRLKEEEKIEEIQKLVDGN
ncbi:OmpA family protein [Ureibacillus chungkukjangi]|uniref:OmpA family protein n=1 Tax=Ureibacillus chungkukjangi TaxID=1202712 RepID=UPI00384A6365